MGDGGTLPLIPEAPSAERRIVAAGAACSHIQDNPVMKIDIPLSIGTIHAGDGENGKEYWSGLGFGVCSAAT